MNLTPDGPLGELDQDKNTLPMETVDALHHGSIGSDQAGNPAEGLKKTEEAFGVQFAEWEVEARRPKSGTSTGNLLLILSRPSPSTRNGGRPSADSSTHRHTSWAHHIRTGLSKLRCTYQQPHGQMTPVSPHPFAGYQ